MLRHRLILSVFFFAPLFAQNTQDSKSGAGADSVIVVATAPEATPKKDENGISDLPPVQLGKVTIPGTRVVVGDAASQKYTDLSRVGLAENPVKAVPVNVSSPEVQVGGPLVSHASLPGQILQPEVQVAPAGTKIASAGTGIEAGQTRLMPVNPVDPIQPANQEKKNDAFVPRPVIDGTTEKALKPYADVSFNEAVYKGDLIPTEREMLYHRQVVDLNIEHMDVEQLIGDLARMSGIEYMMPVIQKKEINFHFRRNPFRALENVTASLGMGLKKTDDNLWLISEVDTKTVIPRIYQLKHVTLDREFTFRDDTAKSTAQQNPQSGVSSMASGGMGNGGMYDRVTDKSNMMAPKSLSTRSGDSPILKMIREIAENGYSSSPDEPTIIDKRVSDDRKNQKTDAIVNYDSDTNTLYVQTTEERHLRIAEYLNGIDQDLVNVELTITFVASDNDDSKDMGINWAGGSSANGLGSGIGLTMSGPENSSAVSTTTPSNTTAGSQPIVFGDITHLIKPTAILSMDAFSAKLKAMISKGDTKIKKRPAVVTENNRETVFTYTQNYPVILASNLTNNLGGGSALTSSGVNVSNENVGTTIRLLGQRIHGDEMNLAIQVEITNVVGSVTSNGTQYPIISKTYVNSNPIVRSGYTITLAGLQDMIRKDSVQKVPLLGDMPILGFAFKEVSKSTTVTNLTLFITARLLDSHGNPIYATPKNVANNPDHEG